MVRQFNLDGDQAKALVLGCFHDLGCGTSNDYCASDDGEKAQATQALFSRLDAAVIRLVSTPFGDDPPGADEFYAALGRALALWARLERHLEMLLMTLPSVAPAGTWKMSVPHSMHQKITLLRRALSTIDALQSVAGVGEKVAADLLDVSSDRNIIVHGTSNGFTELEPLTMSFHTFRQKGDQLIWTTSNVTLADVARFIRETDNLNIRLMQITHPLVRLQRR